MLITQGWRAGGRRGGSRDERMEKENDPERNEGGGDETEERMGLRPWIRRGAQIISLSFSLHFVMYVRTFCMDEVPPFRSAARSGWRRSVE